MGLFDFLSDIPIVGDVVDFVTDNMDTIKDIGNTVQPFVPLMNQATSAYMGYEGQKSANETNIALAHEGRLFNQYQSQLAREFEQQSADTAMNFSAAQAQKQMDFQREAAKTQMDFQSGSVQKQMDFQERMANTSYQRAVQDMKQAGLNPMLAYQQGGAATPSGGTASGSAPGGAAAQGVRASASPAQALMARVENAVSPALNSGNIAARVSAELQNMRVQNENLQKQGKQIDAYTELLKAQVPKVQQETLTSANSATHLMWQSTYLNYQVDNARQTLHNLREQEKKIRSDRERQEFYVAKIQPQELKILELEAQLLGYEIPGARQSAAASEMYNRTILQDILGGVRSVGPLLGRSRGFQRR